MGSLLFILLLMLLMTHAARVRLPTSSREFTNRWVVEVHGGEEVARRVARTLGFTYKGQAVSFENLYVLTRSDHPETSPRDSHHLTLELLDFDEVKWAKQLSLTKRYIGETIYDANPHDPEMRSIISKEQSKNTDREEEPDIPEVRSCLFDCWKSKVDDDDVTDQSIANQQPAGQDDTRRLFNDPRWIDQWYLHETRANSIAVMTHDVVPVYKMGYTGKGIIVAVLDDGINHYHVDLSKNVLKDLNYDMCDEVPGNDIKKGSHGTLSAGVIAMEANNGVCGVGVAYEAKLIGLRMLCETGTEFEESSALAYKPQLVDIYCNSWGPSKTDDNEVQYLTDTALFDGIEEGRGGKGSIYLFAARKQGPDRNCGLMGHVNHVASIAIASASSSGKVSSFSSRCTAVFATAYTSGGPSEGSIVTTGERGNCSPEWGGSHAAPSLAAGILALVLQARTDLTYRDVMHLIAWHSEVAPLANNKDTWYKNAEGFWVSSDFGFGLLNAKNMITNIEMWQLVPEQHTCVIESTSLVYHSFDKKKNVTIHIDSNACQDRKEDAVNYLEQVEVNLSLYCRRMGSVRITLTSPSNTKTILLEPRKRDRSYGNIRGRSIKTVHNWGEKAEGQWIIEVASTLDEKSSSSGYGSITGWKLTFHGTSSRPYHYNRPRRYYVPFRLPSGETGG